VSPSDDELIRQVLLADDHDAFGQLVARHQSAVRAWLRRMTRGDDALADDLAQEAFWRAYRNLRQFRGGAQFRTWLLGIAYNQLRSAARRSSRQAELDDQFARSLEAQTPTLEPGPPRHDLEAALATLTQPQRAAITLCFQQGLTHQEAATVLNCPLGTLKTNLLRGKERMRQLLSRLLVVI
jgi:RNA polymerase sigma-70 factor (ECF subfamily)